VAFLEYVPRYRVSPSSRFYKLHARTPRAHAELFFVPSPLPFAPKRLQRFLPPAPRSFVDRFAESKAPLCATKARSFLHPSFEALRSFVPCLRWAQPIPSYRRIPSADSHQLRSCFPGFLPPVNFISFDSDPRLASRSSLVGCRLHSDQFSLGQHFLSHARCVFPQGVWPASLASPASISEDYARLFQTRCPFCSHSVFILACGHPPLDGPASFSKLGPHWVFFRLWRLIQAGPLSL